MANTTNYNWETPDDTDLVKDGAAAIRTLGSSVDTTTKALNPSTTLGDIEYRSATANTNTRLAIGTTGQVLSVVGGVPAWATSDDANAIQNAIVDAKGDIVAASAADTPARLAVGTDNQRLVAASGEAAGLKYVSDSQNTVVDAAGDLVYGTAADTLGRLAIGTAGQVLKVNSGATAPEWGAAGGGGLVFLNKTDFTATTSTSINNVFTTTYDNYRIYVVGQSTSATNPAFSLRLRASGTDSTADYQCQRIYAQNTTVGADKNALGTDEIYLGDGGNSSFPQSPILMDINSPFLSAHTSLMSNAYESTSSSPLVQIHGGAQTTTNSFDGFTFICSTASTGSIYTYGYAKA